MNHHERRRRRGPKAKRVRCDAAGGKVCYSLNAALIDLARMHAHNSDPDPLRLINVYPCQVGGHYHIGHRPLRMNRRAS